MRVVRDLKISYAAVAALLSFSNAFASGAYVSVGAGPVKITSTDKTEPSKSGNVFTASLIGTKTFTKLHLTLGLGFLQARVSGKNSIYKQEIIQNSFASDLGFYWALGRKIPFAFGLGVEGIFGPGAELRYNKPSGFQKVILASPRIKFEYSKRKYSFLATLRYSHSLNLKSAACSVPIAEIGFGLKMGR